MTDQATDAVAPTTALKDAGRRLLGLLVDRGVQLATDRVGDLADRLTDVAENGGSGLGDALGVGKGGKALLGGLTGGMKGAVKGAFGGAGRGSGKKLKVTVISEDLDIGLPLRTTYNLWTQYEEFPTFMKKVQSVSHEADEKTHWQAKVFWSRREWDATIVEQVPDSHIVWRSKGAKGHVDGAVSFTELGPNLTRVLMVLEYWPQGLFERTGNLWRAQGRRARLEFQHFRRHAMTHTILNQDEVEGWRGEIRDGEVVRTHEDAMEQEAAEREDADQQEGDVEDGELDDEAAEDERDRRGRRGR